MANWFSVRMRASLQQKHISGGEALVVKSAIAETVSALQQRAFSHSRGVPDTCHITVEAVTTPLVDVPLLAITDQAQPLQAMNTFIRQQGISDAAFTHAVALLRAPEQMRGAALIDAVTGERIDALDCRGVRVSRMTYDPSTLQAWRNKHAAYQGARIEEALLLASKVASASGIVGELCMSDDPEYTTGYFASAQSGYTRIHQMKPLGSECGGRVFFTQPDVSLQEVIHYLQRTPVRATSV